MLEGTQNGFRILDRNSVIQPAHQKNHAFAVQYKNQIEKELKEQIKLGHYIVADRKPLVVSAIATIPKDDMIVRLIHDGSRPVGQAMNDYSRPDSVKFQTLQDACSLAKPNYFCAKVDLQAAYRSVPVHSDDYVATGLQ